VRARGVQFRRPDLHSPPGSDRKSRCIFRTRRGAEHGQSTCTKKDLQDNVQGQDDKNCRQQDGELVECESLEEERMSSAESTPDEKVASTATTAKKAAAKKTAAKKVVAKKATTKKAAAKKATAKKTVAKKASAKKTAEEKPKADAQAKPSASAKRTAAKAKKISDSKASAAAVRARAATIQANASENVENSALKDKTTVVPYERDKSGHYMDEAQLKHFSQKLAEWKQQLMEEVDRTVGHMKDDATNSPDPNDRATQEEEFSLELRTRDRERKLIKKINEAQLCIDCKTLEEIRERQTA